MAAREFRHDDPEMEGLYTSDSTAATTDTPSCASMQKMRASMLRKTRMSTAGLRENGSRGPMPEVDEWRARWKLKRQLYGRRKAAKKFHEFVMSATVGLGVEHCPEQPSLFRRPGTTLIFECHQDDFHVSGINVELAWLQEHLGARLKLKLAEPMGPGSQCSYLRATRTRVVVDTISHRTT